MSGGDYAIFVERPIAVALLAVGALVLLMGLVPSFLRARVLMAESSVVSSAIAVSSKRSSVFV